MYRFGRDPACFEALARGLPPDEALGALWLAGRLEMPALQRAVAARLHKLNAGEACDCSLLPLTLRWCRTAVTPPTPRRLRCSVGRGVTA